MISFAEALDLTESCKRHLLLGNGFSIALFPTCFTYGSLFEEAQNRGLLAHTPQLEAAFDALGTIDFEQVMDALKSTVKLAPLYGLDPSATALMAEHAEYLKAVLVEAIAGRHPPRPDEISEEQYQNCRNFLAQFIGSHRENRAGHIYSLNYDLLLYWVVLHDEALAFAGSSPFDDELGKDDGFRAPDGNESAEYVAWEQFEASKFQCLTYLHGALHLFERGPELAKLCWGRAGNTPLMDQIRSALDEDRYPLFVSEGTSKFKMTRINRNAYLAKGLRSFSESCKNKSGALFIIGHSLASNDDHILRRIARGSIGQLFVSIFGDEDSPDNQAIIAKAHSFANARPDRSPLEVEFIDAQSLHIWQ